MKNSAKIALIAVFAAAAVAVGGAAYKNNKKPVEQPATTTEPATFSVSSITENTTAEALTTITEASSSTTEQTSESTSESTKESTTVLLSGPTTTTKAPVSTTTTRRTTTTTKKAVPTTAKKATSPTYINGILIANKSYPLPADYNPGVNPAAQSAFNTMQSAAAREGINLYIVSGFRSYATQASIYNNYVARDGKAAADRYSARPGHSEHQTGLAFDVNSLSQSFENTPEGRWLAANCYKYGFIIRFPKGKESITGYMYEPWHIRYLGTSTATSVYNSGLTLEEYLGIKSVYSY